jgi:hypothetical protein
LTCLSTAAPSWAVFQNSAAATGLLPQPGVEVTEVELLVWSTWLSENHAHDVSVIITITSGIGWYYRESRFGQHLTHQSVDAVLMSCCE